MQKQYYAILMRNKYLNNELVDWDELNDFVPEDSQKILDESDKIIFQSPSYQRTYKEFQNLIKDYPKLKAMAEEDLNETVNTELEMCIVRISLMTNWETLS